MIVRTRTPLRVQREHGVPAKITTNDNGKNLPTGPLVILFPGEELSLPGGVPDEELIVEIDLREISSSNHYRALLHLRTEAAHNEDEVRQLELL